jgi:hypothetical protein
MMDYAILIHSCLLNSNMLPAWEKIHDELAEISTIHGTFAAQMIDKIEHPLRSAIVNDHAYAEVRSVSDLSKYGNQGRGH